MTRSATCALLVSLALLPTAHAQIVWTGAVSNDIFDEANWDLSSSTVTTIAPSVTIDDDVVIRNAPLVRIPNLPAFEGRFQLADGRTLTLDAARLEAVGDEGVSSVPGATTGIRVLVVNGALFEPAFVAYRTTIDVDAQSRLILGTSGDALRDSFVDLTRGAWCEFEHEGAAAVELEYSDRFLVDGQAVQLGQDVEALPYLGPNRSLVRVTEPSLGASYCVAVPNSTGAAAHAYAVGSPVAASGDLWLACSELPHFTLAFFITSRTQGFTANPAGSAGNLCLGGAIGRLLGPFQAQNTFSNGGIAFPLDLMNQPTPTGTVPIVAGDTWNFQCWFRDVGAAGQATANFSDAIAVTFS